MRTLSSSLIVNLKLFGEKPVPYQMSAKKILIELATYAALVIVVFAIAVQPAIGTASKVAGNTMAVYLIWLAINATSRLIPGKIAWTVMTLSSSFGAIYLAWKVAQKFGYLLPHSQWSQIAIMTVSALVVLKMLHCIDIFGKAFDVRTKAVPKFASVVVLATVMYVVSVPQSTVAISKLSPNTTVAIHQIVTQAVKVTEPVPEEFRNSLAEYLLPQFEQASESSSEKVEKDIDLIADSQKEEWRLPNGLISGPDPSLFPVQDDVAKN